ncbi:MAG: aminotransferase class I/II-fold pyridoxal phosphate-dependent enzyme [Planctomycetes bacterium]|nr:aminotransferase class I/II-fold pyridoxal phosphate-dependent enzyme [Planctomycetota bacterium]
MTAGRGGGVRVVDVAGSKRLRSLGAYAFDAVDRQVERLRSLGISPIDFGVGDPTVPTPPFIRERCKAALDEFAASGYPSYAGAPFYRQAVADWYGRRFGVTLDPATEVVASIGAKEAVFNFAEGFVDPGDLVIVPTPGYPPYSRGTLFAEGAAWFVPIVAENDFLIDLNAIPTEVARQARLLWLTTPNSPTGKVAPPDYLRSLVRWGRETNTIICCDEAYTEIYFGEPPHSILEYGREGLAVFQSMSKRSAMTGWRIGWVAGDARIIQLFKKVKTNIDSGAPTFIQAAAAEALKDETHVRAMREEYRAKRDILVKALTALGLVNCTPEATLYVWQKTPPGVTSEEFATRLLAPEVALVTTPGAWLSDRTSGGLNPGEGYVRFALVPSIEETRLAADRLKHLRL